MYLDSMAAGGIQTGSTQVYFSPRNGERKDFVVKGGQVGYYVDNNSSEESEGFYDVEGRWVIASTLIISQKFVKASGRQENEFDVVNRKYGESFFGFMDDVLVKQSSQELGEEPFLSNQAMVEYFKKSLEMKRGARLYPAEGVGRDMMPVGMDLRILDRNNAGGSLESYHLIPQRAWDKPYYGNPGSIDISTGASTYQYFDTTEGEIGVVIYFQYVPLQ